MTTIAGVSTGAGCWLAGDSAVTGAGEVTLQRASKVWRMGGLVIGTAGGVPFESTLRTLDIRNTRNPDVWGAELHDACHGLSHKDGEALIGCEGRLWFFAPGGRPWACGESWGAIGDGSLPANTILRFTARRVVRRALKLTPRDRLRLALEHAEALTTKTRRPFRYLEW